MAARLGLRRGGVVGLVAVMCSAAGVRAGQERATPEVVAASLDPAACVVAPRTAAEMRGLLDIGLAGWEERVGGTTAAGAASPVAPASVPGEAVDGATLAAVTEAAAGYQACSNAGDLPRMLATMTDELAAVYLADFAVFRAEQGGGSGGPTAIGPAERDRMVEELAVVRPRRPDSRVALVGLRDARVVESGCVRASVVWTSTQTAPETFDGVVDFCRVGGRYRWHVGSPPAGVERVGAATVTAG